MATFDEKRRQRFRLMNAVYELTDGDTFKTLLLSEVAAAIGLPVTEADLVAQYLVERGLLKWVTFGPTLALTSQGVDEVEHALAQPKEPTPNFGVINNILNIGTMSGGLVQQGNVESSQTMTVSPDDKAAVRAWLTAVRHTELDAETRVRANVQIEIIEAEVKTSGPRMKILRGAGAVLLAILTGVATAEAIELVKSAPQMLHG